jgi:protein TonB
MRSRRFPVVGALVVALTAVVSGQDIRTTVGPLEKDAKAITPENPIPRRTFSIAPAYPAEARAVEAAAVVTLRITLDRTGRIAEIRRTVIPFVRVAPGAPSTPETLQSVAEAMIRSAAAALSQWQYDAPADGPISFNVVFSFQPGAETTSTQDSRSAPGETALARPVGVAPVPAGPWPAAEGAVRVGGAVRAPAQTRRVNPLYPPEAQAARVQGVVIMEAIIGEDGRVRDTRVLRSIPLLDQAALDAVRQWEYTPTLLNGKATPLVMTVTVQFTLATPPQQPPQ